MIYIYRGAITCEHPINHLIPFLHHYLDPLFIIHIVGGVTRCFATHSVRLIFSMMMNVCVTIGSRARVSVLVATYAVCRCV